jgi:protein dithiol oxidoreductase (disulfide-forming)
MTSITRRRLLTFSTLGALAAMPLRTLAQQTLDRPLEQTFRAILPQKVETGDRIEIIDFFWYGCPFCYELLPVFAEWESRKPVDVTVRRIPAILRETWLPEAHLYYTLEMLGEAERLHARVFDSVHKDRLRTNDPQAVAAWATQNGINGDKWLSTYAAEEVRKRVIRAVELVRTYDVRGTPSIVVDGRYQTGGGLAGGLKNVPLVLDGLVNLAREMRKKA